MKSLAKLFKRWSFWMLSDFVYGSLEGCGRNKTAGHIEERLLKNLWTGYRCESEFSGAETGCNKANFTLD